jgi:hypothetical protein
MKDCTCCHKTYAKFKKFFPIHIGRNSISMIVLLFHWLVPGGDLSPIGQSRQKHFLQKECRAIYEGEIDGYGNSHEKVRVLRSISGPIC